jgi:hypothetical protein
MRPPDPRIPAAKLRSCPAPTTPVVNDARVDRSHSNANELSPYLGRRCMKPAAQSEPEARACVRIGVGK